MHFYGVSAQLKAFIDRLHIPKREVGVDTGRGSSFAPIIFR